MYVTASLPMLNKAHAVKGGTTYRRQVHHYVVVSALIVSWRNRSAQDENIPLMVRLANLQSIRNKHGLSGCRFELQAKPPHGRRACQILAT